MQNLKSTKAVKVLNTGINILGRRDWTVKKMPKTTRKVKWFSRTIPQSYELRIRVRIKFNFRFRSKVKGKVRVRVMCEKICV